MTASEFKTKWSRVQGKETSIYQEHFTDLCRLLGQQTPNEADPSGKDFFCFQKLVTKDAEFLNLDAPEGEPVERGFADVWKKEHFGWEYKGKRKNLDEAYRQLQQYREDLENPPFLIVCDFEHYIIRTNFTGTVQKTYKFTNAEIDEPENWRVLLACFENPDSLKPEQTTAEVTKELAAQIGKVAMTLQERESVELSNVKTRKEITVAKNNNLRIARFLNRLVFCMFAEDTGLLPENLFTNILKASLHNPKHFTDTTADLFKKMQKGGRFGNDPIRHFNGHLFDDFTVFELTEAEIKYLHTAATAEWQFVQPSIMGTLFQRALDFEEGGKLRAQLGAHYTDEGEIKIIVEPVLMSPLRREWAALKATLQASFKRGKGTAEERARIQKFLKKLRTIIVLDPACGSGNFLYVSLQLLLALEKAVINFAAQLGFAFDLEVSVKQLRAIEINPYAFELAQVSVQIGYLQWRRDNGFPNEQSPVLQNLDGFKYEDALLEQRFKKKKSLKAARKKEHVENEAVETHYIERAWPDADVIVGNPPFLGGSKLWEELGREYQNQLWDVFSGRVPGGADLCCYWFEKARKQIENGKSKRAGLLATQGIRGGANRKVLESIKESGDIFFAISDRDWILDGANVHVSMVGFDSGGEKERILDDIKVANINADLSAHADVTAAKPLKENLEISFRGTQKSGDFDIADELAREWLNAPNPNGKPNSDLLKPWLNGGAIVKRLPPVWIIDTGTDLKVNDFTIYEKPYAHAFKFVKPQRDKNKREHRRLNWWLHAETCPGMRTAIIGQQRFLTTPRVSKFRIFSWADSITLPDDGIYIFARSDDYFFGVVHSRLHEVWTRSQGTQVRERESGFRYTPNTCFETFPFPHATPAQENAIAAAAKELNQLREGWLNPPEWTEIRTLEFPGTPDGVWARYIDPATIKEVTLPGQDNIPEKEWTKIKVGTVVYPRREPKDAKCAADLKKRTLTNLYNARPPWLDNAHKTLDAAVAAAYGWPADLTDDQILEKLLALNLERAAEEARTSETQKRRTTREKHAGEMI
jgi:type II restriction/modification system DNA methylase subunit YeeA